MGFKHQCLLLDPNAFWRFLFGRGRVHQLVFGRNREELNGRLVEIDLRDRQGQRAGAGVAMLREEIDVQFLAVPDFIGDHDGAVGAAVFGGDRQDSAEAMNFHAVNRARAKVLCLEVRVGGSRTHFVQPPVGGRFG